MDTNSHGLIKLLQLVSPALPVGAYAYSQGQEYAVEAGWINSGKELFAWLDGLLRYGLAQLEIPVLKRCYHAWASDRHDDLSYWNDFVLANRETQELLLEDEQLGIALQRLLVALKVPGAKRQWVTAPSFVTMFALAGQCWQIPVTSLMQGYAWSWLETQMAAASKTIPLGQTEIQILLATLAERLPSFVAQAEQLEDSDLGNSLPGLAIASAQHERQYTRLFRS